MLYEAASLLPGDWSITAVALRQMADDGSWQFDAPAARIDLYVSKRC
jgi:hypothetical protein